MGCPFVGVEPADESSSWLATVDNVKTRILLLSEEVFIPELAL